MLLRVKTLILFTVFSGTIYSQSNTLSTGANASGTNGSVSYSVGQIDYISQTGSNGNMNQGLQQPYEFYSTNSIDEFNDVINLTIGPNPTEDELMITYIGDENLGLLCSMFDAEGKEIIPSFSLIKQATLDMKDFSTGMYSLVVRSGLKEIKTYKIIKH
jgi:hypothetical protein